MAKKDEKHKTAWRKFLGGVGTAGAAVKGTAERMPGVASRAVGGAVDRMTGVPNTIGGTIGKAGDVAGRFMTQSPVQTGREIGSFLAQRPEGGMTRFDKLGRAAVAPGKAVGKFYGGKTMEGQPSMESRMMPEQAPAETMAPAGGTATTPQVDPVPATGAGFMATSGADRLNKLFPGREQAAAMHGIRTLGATDEQKKLAGREGSVRDARTLEDKAGLRAGFRGQDAAELARRENIAGRQQLMETQVQGEVMKAMAGDQMAMNKIKADYYKADKSSQAKMFGDMLKGLNPDGLMEPAQFIEQATALAEQLGVNQAGGGAQGGMDQAGGGDLNGDGEIDENEAEYNKAVALMASTKGKMSPADELRLKTKISELKKQILG